MNRLGFNGSSSERLVAHLSVALLAALSSTSSSCDRLKPGGDALALSDATSDLDAPSDVGTDGAPDVEGSTPVDASTMSQFDGSGESASEDSAATGDATMDALDFEGEALDAPEADLTDMSADAPDVDVADSAADQVEGDVTTDSAAPQHVAASHLRLWLTADRGLSCSGGRVSRWADQSPNGDDATLQNGQLGPQCEIEGGTHSVQGVSLPYFSGAGTNVFDETLDVDLSFLVGADYTIFVVERRWDDYPDGTSNAAELILGTTLPTSVQEGAQSACAVPDVGLAVGYIYYAGSTQITLDQLCDTFSVNVNRVPSPPPAPLSYDTFLLDQQRGHEVWSDNAPASFSLSTTTLAMATGGAIGRAFNSPVGRGGGGSDGRFHGDIAELVVYDAALEDADRSAMNAYLSRHWGI